MIHVGDCLEIMRGMDAGSVHTCITSPPYYGLRDYGVDGQIGLESTPAEFVSKLVEVFREVRRVLRDDGTLWLNLGDTYASKPNGSIGATGLQGGLSPHVSVRQAHARRASSTPLGFKHKDLMGIPWRVAFALQDDGWYLRQDIIWAKPNPMPESVTDRCTKAHEYLFLLSKSPRYYFDNDAIRENASYTGASNGVGFGHGTDAKARARGRVSMPKGWDTSRGQGGHGSFHKDGAARAARDSFKRTGSKRSASIPGQSVGTHREDRAESRYDPTTRNKRSVWTVPTMPFKEAHFATFPERLIEPCVLAGAPAGGIVLDPFMGAGTTAVVAERLGRRWIGCELKPEYAAIAEARINATQPGLSLGDVA